MRTVLGWILERWIGERLERWTTLKEKLPGPVTATALTAFHAVLAGIVSWAVTGMLSGGFLLLA